MPVAIGQARSYLESLGLTSSAAVLYQHLDQAAHRPPSHAEFLADLLAVEVAARRERCLKARTRLAHFPFHKTLEEFEFAFQLSIVERQVRELAQLAFGREAANVLLLGPAGCGQDALGGGVGAEGH